MITHIIKEININIKSGILYITYIYNYKSTKVKYKSLTSLLKILKLYYVSLDKDVKVTFVNE